jgi:hypothetical protein
MSYDISISLLKKGFGKASLEKALGKGELITREEPGSIKHDHLPF